MSGDQSLQSVTWAEPLTRYLLEAGVDPAPIRRACGIDDQVTTLHDPALPFSSVVDFFERAAIAAGDDMLGFHFGQSLGARDAGVLGYLGQTAPNLLDAVSSLITYRAIYSESCTIDDSRLRDAGEVSVGFEAALTAPRRQFVEFTITHLVASLRSLVSGQLILPHVGFEHHRTSGIEEVRRFFGGTVGFGEAATSLRFNTHDLQGVLRTYDPRLHEIIDAHCRTLVEQSARPPSSLPDRIAGIVSARLASGDLGLDDIASEVGMSGRTLARRLKQFDTSLSQIIDELRRSLAQRWLANSDLDLAEIAYRLGYSEVSAFDHAFKRWTGTPPSTWRDERT